MADANDLYGQAVTALNTAVGAGTHLSSDWLPTVPIPSGQTKGYQLRVDPLAVAEGANSNESYRTCAVDVVLLLAVGTTESDAERDAWRDLIEAVLPPSFWRALAAVRDVAEGPELQGDTERVGNVLRATVSVQVDLKP